VQPILGAYGGQGRGHGLGQGVAALRGGIQGVATFFKS